MAILANLSLTSHVPRAAIAADRHVSARTTSARQENFILEFLYPQSLICFHLEMLVSLLTFSRGQKFCVSKLRCLAANRCPVCTTIVFGILVFDTTAVNYPSCAEDAPKNSLSVVSVSACPARQLLTCPARQPKL